MREWLRRVNDDGSFTRRWANGALRHPRSIVSTKALVQAMLPSVQHSFVDIGAGVGTCVKFLRATGRFGYGIDGIEGVEGMSDGLVRWANLTKPLPLTFEPMLTAICIEVGEHIPAEFSHVFLDNVTSLARRTLVLSWAPEHRAGTGHVNCQNAPWVWEQLRSREFGIDLPATELLQNAASRGWRGKTWVARRLSPIAH